MLAYFLMTAEPLISSKPVTEVIARASPLNENARQPAGRSKSNF